MNLKQYLSKIERIPVCKHTQEGGNAEGIVVLRHPAYMGGIKKTELATEGMLILLSLRDNPETVASELWSVLVEERGFDDLDLGDCLRECLQIYKNIGAVQTNDKIMDLTKDTQIKLYDGGLEKIAVQSAKPKNPSKEKSFRKYFPKP